NGLTITANNSVVLGLDIDRFGNAGVDLRGTGDQVEGCYLGTDITGAKALGNSVGVLVESNGNTIGGTAAGAGNLISGNSLFFDVWINGSSNNQVQGNIIGTDVTGTRSLGRSRGIDIEGGTNNLIGGTAAGAGNLISGYQFGAGIAINA